MNYSKYKKNEQSVLLYGNDNKISSNHSFVMPSKISLAEIPKLNHNKTSSQVESKKDFSKIIMEGRKMMNPLISVKQTQERRKVRSHPR